MYHNFIIIHVQGKRRMLGLGCYGGKQAKEFMTLGYKGNAANGSEQDLKALGDIPEYQLQGFDGLRGHRECALECLAQNSECTHPFSHCLWSGGNSGEKNRNGY